MDPVIYVILGTMLLGIAEASVNKQLKRKKQVNSRGLLLIGSIVSIILTFLWMIMFQIDFSPLSIKSLSLIILISLIYYGANNFYYTSYKKEEASTISVLMMFSIVVSTIIGQVVFREVIALQQWLGIIIVMFAVFRINLDEISLAAVKKLFSPSSAKGSAILGASLYGLGFGLSKLIVQDIDPHYYQFLDVLIGIPLMFVVDFKRVSHQLKIVTQKSNFMAFAPLILLYFFYNKFKFLAFANNIALPVADAVDNTVVFVILAVEFFVFKVEQDSYIKKLIWSLVAFAGVLLIGIG